MGVILWEWNGIFLQFFRGDWDGKKRLKFCDAFWKQEMSPALSNAATWLEKPVLKDLLLVIIWVSTHILNAFGRIQ